MSRTYQKLSCTAHSHKICGYDARVKSYEEISSSVDIRSHRTQTSHSYRAISISHDNCEENRFRSDSLDPYPNTQYANRTVYEENIGEKKNVCYQNVGGNMNRDLDENRGRELDRNRDRKSGRDSDGDRSMDRNKSWICTFCSYENLPYHYKFCFKCRENRPSRNADYYSSKGRGNDDSEDMNRIGLSDKRKRWDGKNDTRYDNVVGEEIDRKRRKNRDNYRSLPPNFRCGDWMCPSCGAHNFAKTEICICRCSKPDRHAPSLAISPPALPVNAATTVKEESGDPNDITLNEEIRDIPNLDTR